ncbi:MAG: transcriptional repressor LexA [bacterium]|nr:transcriptional repressor LexA [bacterium]
MPIVLYRRQRQIIDFLRQFVQQHGFSPTLQEIANAIGVTSLATIHEHLATLARKHVIRRYEGAVRGIDLMTEDLQLGEGSVEIPILGTIAAGSPIEPYTDPSASMQIAPQFLSGKRRSYVLQVKGNSMIEDGILDGDFVVIEEQETANNGDIVVALLENGVATLKRYFKEATRIRLEPANASMKPIYATEVRVQGKVIAVIRKYRN